MLKHEPPLNPPEPEYREDGYCENCGEPYGLYAYEADGEWLCEECFKEWLDNLTLDEMAEAMGIRTKFVG